MRRPGNGLLALLLGLGIALGARAGVVDAPGEDLEVSLITYGPGAIYWERFGHDAIRIRDRVSGQSIDVNYGVFDFEERVFLLNFARGRMQYMIDVERSDLDQKDFVDAGRSVLEQRLALSATQAMNLRRFLLWNLRPENAHYSYDYLTSNCATRVRDALNTVLGGVLETDFTARPASMTYRQQIDRLMSGQPGLMLGMDFGLGPFADRPLNEWQESFLPMVLARELRNVRIADSQGGTQPLVMSERQLAPSRLTPPPPRPPGLEVPLGIAGLVLALALLVARRRRPALYAVLEAAYLIFAGIMGTVLLALWTLTAHRAGWANANLLVFNPFAFVILAARRARRGKISGRPARALVSLQLGAVVLGVLLYSFAGDAQQNLPWLLFAGPVWLAIAAGSPGARVGTGQTA